MCSLGNKKIEYKNISYENEILAWLDECNDIARTKPLSQAIIQQYSSLIKQLTFKDEDMEYVDKMKQLLLAPNNILAVGEILKLQEEWVESIIEEIHLETNKRFLRIKRLDI